MSQFARNARDFAADCVREDGCCTVARENFLFLDDGKELSAVDYLQRNCGHVVIMPEGGDAHAWLYHTSCQRMTDVVQQIFLDCLDAPVRLPHGFAEMTVGELHRRRITLPYGDCKVRVEGFDFRRETAS